MVTPAGVNRGSAASSGWTLGCPHTRGVNRLPCLKVGGALTPHPISRAGGEGKKSQQAIEFVLEGDEGGAGVVRGEGLHECEGYISFAGKVRRGAPQARGSGCGPR